MAVTLTGHAGEVRWSYHRAASLGAWTLKADGDAIALTAAVRHMDVYRISQRPVTFVVPRQKGPAWCWPITSLQIADGTLSASLGPQE